MPLQEAKISTNIRLRFRTAQKDSLIFLGAGRTDYALVNLEQGRVKFTFKINEHNVEMLSPVGAKALNDLDWHEISIQRYDKNITMQVDEHFVRHTLPEEVAELNIHFGVFLGGVGDFSEAYLDTVVSFRGCMSDVSGRSLNCQKKRQLNELSFPGLLQQHKRLQESKRADVVRDQCGRILDLCTRVRC